MNRVFFIGVCVLSAVFSVGCRNSQKQTAVDLSVFRENLEYGTRWGVITEPYATFRINTDFIAPVSGHGRRGDMEKVLGQVLIISETNQYTWYAFEKGWLPGLAVSIHSNRLKAQRVSDSMKE
jgi:hypothetical protein